MSSLVLADGFEEAFIGVAERSGFSESVAVYDYDRCIEILMDPEVNEDMSMESAIEYFEYNVLGSWVGEQTPIFIRKLSLQDASDMGL
jgi:hypothetical protein